MIWTKAISRFFSFNHKRKKLCTLKIGSIYRLNHNQSYNGPTKLWKVIFYGTDEFSEETLKVLYHNWKDSSSNNTIGNLEVICIKSDCPVKQFVLKNGVKFYTWPHKIPENVYDVGVVVSFGHMIPTDSILACKYGIINAHPSLLPRWRGAAPILHTILNGDSETGVTITQVSPNKFDVGNILNVEKFPIPPGITAKELRDNLSIKAAGMILKTLQNLEYYFESSYPQSKEGVTKAPKIQAHKCYIDWEEDTALNIYRKFKAFHGLFDLFTFWKDMKVDILDCEKVENVEKANVSQLLGDLPTPPGFCYFHKKRKVIFVKCKNGWSGISSMRIPRKGKITAQDFYNGFISKEKLHTSYFKTSREDITIK